MAVLCRSWFSQRDINLYLRRINSPPNTLCHCPNFTQSALRSIPALRSFHCLRSTPPFNQYRILNAIRRSAPERRSISERHIVAMSWSPRLEFRGYRSIRSKVGTFWRDSPCSFPLREAAGAPFLNLWMHSGNTRACCLICLCNQQIRLSCEGLNNRKWNKGDLCGEMKY